MVVVLLLAVGALLGHGRDGRNRMDGINGNNGRDGKDGTNGKDCECETRRMEDGAVNFHNVEPFWHRFAPNGHTVVKVTFAKRFASQFVPC